jgi:hypothetical protein
MRGDEDRSLVGARIEQRPVERVVHPPVLVDPLLDVAAERRSRCLPVTKIRCSGRFSWARASAARCVGAKCNDAIELTTLRFISSGQGE